MHLRIKPLNRTATNLYMSHDHHHTGDSGLDLYVLEDQVIEPGETAKIKLGIAAEALEHVGYFLMARSSICKTPLRLANSVGLIDAGYRGEIMAVVDNIKAAPYTVHRGDRLFQLVSADLSPITFIIVDKLSETSRGEGGFGSTGK